MLGFLDSPPYFFDILYSAGLIVDRHYRHQPGLGTEGCLDLFRRYSSIGFRFNQGKPDPKLLQKFCLGEDSGMFDGGDDDMAILEDRRLGKGCS